MNNLMDNPFQSPETASPAIVEDDGVKCPHLLVRLFYGWFFGSVFGVFFGISGSVLLGMLYKVVIFQYEQHNQFPIPLDDLLLGSAFLGAFSGGLSGGIVGPLVTLITAAVTPRRRQWLPYLTSGASAIAGVLFGIIGGVMVGPAAPVAWNYKLGIIAGGMIGLLAGIIGGLGLGRFLRHWNY